MSKKDENKDSYSKTSWSRGLVKSRQKNGRDSQFRETGVGEKIAATSVDPWRRFCGIRFKKDLNLQIHTLK